MSTTEDLAKAIGKTPRTDAFIDSQAQEQFYGGTESNINSMVWKHYQKLQTHARQMESELLTAAKRSQEQAALIEKLVHVLRSNHSGNCNVYSECDYNLGCNCGYIEYRDEALAHAQGFGKEKG